MSSQKAGRKGRVTVSSGEESPPSVRFGELCVFSGSLIAIQALGDDGDDEDEDPYATLPTSSSCSSLMFTGTTKWLSEGKKSNWALSELDMDPESAMLEDVLPFSSMFRVTVLGTSASPEPCVTLQSMASGCFLSRPKERDMLGAAKNTGKNTENVNVYNHPIWNMAKGKVLFPLYEKEGVLHCGPGSVKPIFFEVLVLDWARVSSRSRSDEKKGMKATKFFELKKKKTKRSGSSSVADVSASIPVISGSPQAQNIPGNEKLVPSPSIEFQSGAKTDDEAKINDALSMWLATSETQNKTKEKKKKRTLNHAEAHMDVVQNPLVAGTHSAELKRRAQISNSPQIEEESVAPWTTSRKNMTEEDHLYLLLESTLHLLGVDKEKIDSQVKTLKERDHNGEPKTGGTRLMTTKALASKQKVAAPYNMELDAGFRAISERVVLPLLSQNEKIRMVVVLQKTIRGYLVRNRKEKFMKSLVLPPPAPTPKENLRTLVQWANTLYQGGEMVRWCLEIFLLDRVEPLHSIASMDPLWIDMMTVEALFGAWLDFVRRQCEWQRNLKEILDKEWPVIDGVVNHLFKYAGVVGEAAEDLANQTQAVFETYENIRSLEKFLPYSKNIDVMKRLKKQKELKNESFTSAFTAPVEKQSLLKTSHSPELERSPGLGKEEEGEESAPSPGLEKRKVELVEGPDKKRKRRSFLNTKGVRRRSITSEEKDLITTKKEDKEAKKQDEKNKDELLSDLHVRLEKRKAEEDPSKKVMFSSGDSDNEDEEGEEREAPWISAKKELQFSLSPPNPASPGRQREKEKGDKEKEEKEREEKEKEHKEKEEKEEEFGDKKTSSSGELFENPATSTAMSFWKKKEETSLSTQSGSKTHLGINLVNVNECPKYLPGFGAGAGVCRRCKSPASQHGRNFEKEENEKEATKREEEKAKEGEEKEEVKEEKGREGPNCDEKRPKRDLRLKLGSSGKGSAISFCDDSVLTYRTITLSVLRDLPGETKVSVRGDEESDPLEYINLTAPKPFRWFISLPYEHLQFVKEHVARLLSYTQHAPIGTSDWAKKSHTQAQNTLNNLRDLQNRVTRAMNAARVASTAARFGEIPNFKMPHYDEICGDGPLRMLLVESNVVLSKNEALIERHLLMFTDLILLLKRNLKDGTWEVHDDFGGLIYFGLVLSATNQETQEGCFTSLKFIDINSKSESTKCIELFGRHVAESTIWCDRFCERIDANHLIFEKPITQVLEQEGGLVPYIVRVTVDELIARGTEEEGIFRLAGNIKRVRYLRVLFNKGMNRYVHPDVLKEEDVTTLGALLKLYLRELPEPLFSYDTYDQMLEAKGNLRSKYFLEQMDLHNRNVLLCIMKLLRLIVLNSEKTKMSAHNLAIVFSPNLFQPRKGQRETPESMAMSTAVIQSLIEYFVRHADKCTLIEPPPTKRK